MCFFFLYLNLKRDVMANQPHYLILLDARISGYETEYPKAYVAQDEIELINSQVILNSQ